MKIVLRNARGDNLAWFFTGCAFVSAGLAGFCGLVIANMRDPSGRWLGPSVKSPQVIYLVLEGLTLIFVLAGVTVAIVRGKRAFDRSVQLTIDEAGIHDFRSAGQEIRWADVADIKPLTHYSGAIAVIAQLQVVTKSGDTLAIDVLGLDQDHKAILKQIQRIRSTAV
jgi:hypothetical protein